MHLGYPALYQHSFLSLLAMNLINLQFSTSATRLNDHQCTAKRAYAFGNLQKSQTKCNSRGANVKGHRSIMSPDLQKERRSADYHPTIWDPQLVESLKSSYCYESFNSNLEELKKECRRFLKEVKEPIARLELISSMQRLGVAYHFEEDIKEALDITYYSEKYYSCDDLHTTALQFYILRQHQYYPVPSAELCFEKFKNEDGRFKEYLSRDTKGILSFYEASHQFLHGEDLFDETKKFTYRCLESLKGHTNIDQAMLVQHSLETPLHWRMLRLESRNYIDVYERYDNKNLVLLELAKLDFNLVQSVHQTDLIELSRWWKELGFKEELAFSRDRLVENFIWAMGIIYEPQFSKCRIGLTKFICILTAIDDIYDVYGSPDELELFTEAVSRWDVKAAENLPKYMKICYLAMFNFANMITHDIQRDQGICVLPYIVKEWISLCKSYLVEARWFYNGYTPTLEEYLGNAWTSVGELVYWASVITRINDDLGTSTAEMKRGDIPKSIQCFKNEKGVTEEEATEHIKSFRSNCWKKLNQECMKTSLPKSVVNLAVNMARTSHCIFEHGDGIGTSHGVTKDRAVSLFIEPIEIKFSSL
ncbi:hypothetical protein IFM89_029762 [Coptis chinensis]|uniref:Uncharacterized protein n=1 Tax=Coptis chinensis TaxID=261450 RepID=A0A835M2C7_9MAGN|nr:hypothetical protein IFM89_029762 [Coptis chinensis]